MTVPCLVPDLTGLGHGAVLDGTGENAFSIRPGEQGRLQGGGVGFGPATGEDDFLGMGFDQGGDRFASFVDGFSGGASEAITC